MLNALKLKKDNDNKNNKLAQLLLASKSVYSTIEKNEKYSIKKIMENINK